MLIFKMLLKRVLKEIKLWYKKYFSCVIVSRCLKVVMIVRNYIWYYIFNFNNIIKMSNVFCVENFCEL